MSRTLLAIDPGVRSCGVALLHKGEVRHAGFLGPDVDVCDAIESIRFEALMHSNNPLAVIEFPRTYRGRAERGDTNDLLRLAYWVGRLHERLARQNFLVKPVPVADWKRNTPTNIIEARLKRPPPIGLTKEEWARVALPAKSYQHNVFDAIALARWAGSHLTFSDI